MRSLPSEPERKPSFSPDSPSPFDNARASPTPASPAQPALDSPFGGARSSSKPNIFDSPSAQKQPGQLNLRPTAQRTVTSSTAATLRQPNFSTNKPETSSHTAPEPTLPTARSTSRLPSANPGGNYNHIPPALLHSLRESFEVLDTESANALTPASLAKALAASGLDPSSLPASTDFFPPTNGHQHTLNLSQYLSSLSAPLANLSSPEELAAAFGAFDLEDSGQIDLDELQDAVMHTAPEPGEEDFRLSEQEVDAVMAGFVGRRSFTGAPKVPGSPTKKGRGEVFRWREFVGAVGWNEGGGAVGV